MARDSGLNPFQTAGLYLASDVLLAVVCEPLLILLRWESRRVVWLAELGARLKHMSTTTGFRSGRVRGPLGLVLFSFVIGPAPARALSETAGYRPISGWALAIVGDMLYFGLGMAATLTMAGVLLVRARNLMERRRERRPQGSRLLQLTRVVPLASSATVVVVGLFLAARGLAAL